MTFANVSATYSGGLIYAHNTSADSLLFGVVILNSNFTRLKSGTNGISIKIVQKKEINV